MKSETVNEAETSRTAEAQPRCAPAAGSELRIQGAQARLIIKNVHALVRHKFRGASLWSLVGQITGHGSGYSYDICKSANLNPNQCCGGKELVDDVPNDKLTYRREQP